MDAIHPFETDGGCLIVLRALHLGAADRQAWSKLTLLDEYWDAAAACRLRVADAKDDKTMIVLLERTAMLVNRRNELFTEFMVAFLSDKHGREEIEGKIVPSCTEDDMQRILLTAREGWTYLARLKAIFVKPPENDSQQKSSS